MRMLEEGHKVRLPEWRGYWFMDKEGEVLALTKNGDIAIPWISEKHSVEYRLFLHARKDWEIAEGLDFGWAICALKAGKLVTRKGWNGKGMFLFIRPSDEIDVQFIPNIKSLPESFKKWFGQQPYRPSPESPKIKFTPYICMKAADGSIVNGWLASQTDMLAEDWQLFEV